MPFPLGLPGPCPGRPRDQRLSVPALPRRWLVPGAPLSEATAPVRPQVLIDWINDVLVEERIIVKQLEEDLYDGQVLQKLLGESPGRGGPRTLHGATARGPMAPRWQPPSSRLRGAPGHLLSHCHSWVSPQRSPPCGCVDHTQLPKLWPLCHWVQAPRGAWRGGTSGHRLLSAHPPCWPCACPDVSTSRPTLAHPASGMPEGMAPGCALEGYGYDLGWGRREGGDGLRSLFLFIYLFKIN